MIIVFNDLSYFVLDLIDEDNILGCHVTARRPQTEAKRDLFVRVFSSIIIYHKIPWEHSFIHHPMPDVSITVFIDAMNLAGRSRYIVENAVSEWTEASINSTDTHQ